MCGRFVTCVELLCVCVYVHVCVCVCAHIPCRYMHSTILAAKILKLESGNELSHLEAQSVCVKRHIASYFL